MRPPDALVERLDRLVATAQSEQRAPSVSAAVFRDGDVLWRRALGSADVDREEPATPEHAYRIGSITKTFTAVCILQLRDAGVLELDDPLRNHVPEAPAGPTVADALAHLSGLQREPPGEIWETLQPPSREELLAGLEDAERVLRPAEAWHYSNLAFGLLGEIVARRSDAGYEAALRDRVLEPLGLARTGFDPPGPRATGYYVHPYSDRVTVEAELPVEGPTAAMGWLWSTVDDLARWADFLSSGSDGVLARETLDEMARVRTMVDDGAWSLGWGLGTRALPQRRAGLRRPRRRDARVPRRRVRPPAGAYGRGRPPQHRRGRASGDTRARARGGGARSAASHVRSPGGRTMAPRTTSRRYWAAGGRKGRSSCSPGGRVGSGWRS